MFDFSGLIDALMRRAREEETRGPTATQLMINLPRDETLIVLTEVIKALAALNRNPRIGLKERYRAVQGFDEKARPLAALLVRIYRGEEHIDTILPHQVLPSLLACWKELASAYKLCLKQHAQSPSPRFARDAELITLRAVSYYAEQAKWAYLRYFDAEPRLWRSLNRLYQIAEAAGFGDKLIAPYEDARPVSVSHVYRHALLLRLCEPERHRSEELWLIDRCLHDWLHLVSLEKIIRPRDQTFAVNLDEQKPPMKLRRNMVGERYRYLDTEPLADFVAELASIARQGVNPAGMPPQPDLASTTRLLTDLSTVYSRAGQARSRRSERRHKDKASSVGIGLGRICQLLRSGSNEQWEGWTLVDESGNGLGAHYKAHFDDRLTIGELLAVKTDDVVWLTIVRRLQKSRDGQVRVGAERVAAQPVPVLLEQTGAQLAALYCAESPHGRILLMPRQHHRADASCLLVSGNKRFRIQQGPALESLPEYTLCSFSVLGKQADDTVSEGGR